MPSKKDPATELAEKLLATLAAQRQIGKDAYPLPLKQLVTLTDAQAPPALFQKAIAKKLFKERVALTLKKNPDAPVVLAEDLEVLAASPLALEFVCGLVCSPQKPTAPIAALKGKVDARLKQPFEAAVKQQIQDNSLPPSLECIRVKNVVHLHPRHLPLLKAPEEQLADKLLALVEAQRQLGADAYPLSLKRLLELTGVDAKVALVKKALALPVLRAQLALVDVKNPLAPLALAEDAAQLAASSALLEFLLRGKRKEGQHAFAAENLLPKKSPLLPGFLEAVKERIDAGTLPATIGWLWVAKKKALFFMDDVHSAARASGGIGAPSAALVQPVSAAAATQGDFARLFDDAFAQIDRHNGAHNFVNLVDLRRRLGLPRAVFESELRNLRLAGRYTLSAAEGRHGLTPEEQHAGIMEQGTLLLYMSRR